MKGCIAITIFVLAIIQTSAQQFPPEIKWQRTLGDTGKTETPGNIIQTSDGGLVLLSNIPAVPYGQTDISIVKLSKTGTMEWRRIIDSAEQEFAGEIKNTPDGGFILVGSRGSLHLEDVWLYKLDQYGEIQWQKRYGGSANDRGYSVEVLNDGYIFLAYTQSSDGDITGTRRGVSDIWACRVDINGAIRWTKIYGGIYGENAHIIKKTVDGGFIFTGTTLSPLGVTGFHFSQSGADIWIVKIDANGTITWEKCYGGKDGESASDIVQTSDGGYIVTGRTESFDGDLPPFALPVKNAWVFRIDAAGKIIWNKTFGADYSESVATIIKDASGGYLVGGHLQSAPNVSDAWLFKIDESGTTLWEKTYGGSKDDAIQRMLIDMNNDVVFSGLTYSVDGDVKRLKNLPVQTRPDLWIVKTGSFNVIKGSAFIDYNSNGVKDGNDRLYNAALIKTEKSGFSYQSSTINGQFRHPVDTGSYITNVGSEHPYYTVVPTTYPSTFNTYYNNDSVSFAFQPIAGKRDYQVFLFSADNARQARTVKYIIHIRNAGTDTLNNQNLHLIIDNRLSYVNASQAPVKFSADTISFYVGVILPGDSLTITVDLNAGISPQTKIGDTLISVAVIDTTGDLRTDDNIAQLRQVVSGSYDPNDKTESNAGFLLRQDIESGTGLLYTIRFQNTGTDTAFEVIITDTLDNKLQWNSVEMVAASHPFKFTIDNGNQLSWSFPGIQLPDSNRNEPASHGFLVYRIKTGSNFRNGDTIRNSASIYFDFNEPVKTNTHLTTLRFPVPETPSISQLAQTYCANAGTQKIKINNLPATVTDSVIIELDGTRLLPGKDSTFSFDPGILNTGDHSLVVSFENAGGETAVTKTFSVTPVVTPMVDLLSSDTRVSTFLPDLLLTATGSGGGTSPVYSFAKDRSFANVLQEGTANAITIQPASLPVGNVWFYVKMNSGASCRTSESAIDSIIIAVQQSGGINDQQDNGRLIGVYPNPFKGQLTINGLNPSKHYSISITSTAGRKLFETDALNSGRKDFQLANLSPGIYIVSVYDQQSGRLIGKIKVLKK